MTCRSWSKSVDSPRTASAGLRWHPMTCWRLGSEAPPRHRMAALHRPALADPTQNPPTAPTARHPTQGTIARQHWSCSVCRARSRRHHPLSTRITVIHAIGFPPRARRASRRQSIIAGQSSDAHARDGKSRIVSSTDTPRDANGAKIHR